MGQPIAWCPVGKCHFAMNLTPQGWVCPNERNHLKPKMPQLRMN